MFIRSVDRVVLLAGALFVLSAGCSISFVPADGQGPTAGSEIKDGKYVVSKVPAGTMLVQIRYAKATGKKKLYDTPDSPTRDTFTEVLPRKYNDETELRLEVQPGKNEKNWELSTK
jgi:hypothetical protein